ncbi:MAG: Alpha-glucosidase [uncultured Actinomycetospora sp.]|uniref:Alpha-glucosidase n=1 Tax=uncultured Actinomycetospora sp. TaxID=1135996 RepID=A0A6J4HJX1_9PSEU|nr:MAG: Alpha-glucosidase [uncultured Actinomycetospora sp.]
MVGPLLESKYRVPGRRPGTITRPRLLDVLGGTVGAALTVVSAPAGFGKSTLLAEWLAAVPPSTAAVAWVSLDERDDDPARFWTYAVAAVQAATGVGDSALGLLTSSPSSSEAALVAVLNDIGGMSRDLVLVLDDLHLVTSPAVHEGITFLLEHRPPQLHLVLATRVDPPLPLARWRARGELVEIRAADLRFTEQESATYLNGPMGLSLSEHDVAILDRRAEGWIAALQLAALSMRGRDDVGAFIAGFAGDDRYVVDYLAEEVLARLPDATREFLLQTSVLERLTGPLCDAVTGREGGRGTLLALERANLFLVPLDDRRQWYRYHHLFADVLRAHLTDERAETVPELHRRASTWLSDAGDAPAAVDHALAGGHVDRAADLMERAMPTMRRERREAELVRWVRSLPDEVVRVRPVLGMAFVGALAQASQFDTVEQRLADVERAVRPAGGAWPAQAPPGLVVVDEEGYRSVPAGLEMYRAALALRRADLGATSGHAREALSLAPATDDLTRAAAGALGGLASWARGDLARAATLLMLALPGSAYVYQGEELGLPEHTTLPDELRQDPTWLRTGRTVRGRDGCRVPVPWVADAPAYGFSPTGRTWLPQPEAYGPLARDRQRGVPGSTYEMYRAALALRRECRLGEGSLEWLPGLPDGVLGLRNGEVVALVNVTGEPVAVPDGLEVVLASGELDGDRLPAGTAVWAR